MSHDQCTIEAQGTREGSFARVRCGVAACWLDIVLLLVPLAAGWFVLAGDVNFPVHDDCLAARSVKRWLETGELRISSFATPSWVSQIAWGAAFCLPFGFSFHALRLSVLVLTGLAVSTTYLLTYELCSSRRAAALAAAVVVANPLMLQWAYSFMSDASFVGLTTGAMYFYVRGLRRSQPAWVWAGAAMALAAALLRQPALLLPPIVAAYIFARHWIGPARITARHCAALITATVTLPVVGFATYLVWLLGSRPMPSAWRVFGDSVARNWTSGAIFVTAYGSAMLVGFFMLPLLPGLIAWFKAEWKEGAISGIQKVALIGSMTVLLVPQLLRPGRTCLTMWPGNQFRNCMLGPVPLHDNLWGIQGDLAVRWPIQIWQVLSIPSLVWVAIAMMAGWYLIRILGAEARPVSEQGPSQADAALYLMIAGSGVAMAAFMLFVFWVHFERYWLVVLTPLAVPAAALSAGRLRGWVWAMSVAGLLVLASVSCIMVHDYYAWNKARWFALNELEKQGVTYLEIDGGYEYNTWHWSEWDIDLAKPQRPPEVPERPRNLWWVMDDVYCIAFQDLSGLDTAAIPTGSYARVMAVPWFSWAICRERAIYVLRRS